MFLQSRLLAAAAMTRLAQALRWWRNRPCECLWGDCPVTEGKIVHSESIPPRHCLVLSRAGMIERSTSVLSWVMVDEADSPVVHGSMDTSFKALKGSGSE